MRGKGLRAFNLLIILPSIILLDRILQNDGWAE